MPTQTLTFNYGETNLRNDVKIIYCGDNMDCFSIIWWFNHDRIIGKSKKNGYVQIGYADHLKISKEEAEMLWLSSGGTSWED